MSASRSGGARAFQASVVLRASAILIAMAGVVDPAISMSGTTRARLAVVAEQPSPSADRVRTRLIQSLGSSYEIVPAITSDAVAAVVIGDRYPRTPAAMTLPIATVSIGNAGSPHVRIVRIDAPAEAPAGTAIRVGVDVEGIGAAGRSTDVVARIAGLEVGRVSHRWTSARERWRGAIDTVPVGGPPFVVRVEAAPLDNESQTDDNASDAVVDERRDPFRVLMYEPRPSWAATFVRRALEADTRFQVAGRSVSSRGIAAVTRDDVPLSDPRLDTFDVVIAGGLERLSAADVRSLDRYLRGRGGAVVLVPDVRPDAGPARELLPAEVTERLLEQPAKLTVMPPAGALEASELLVLGSSVPGTETIASTPGGAASRDSGSPVVVSMPHGGGRLLVSGAMDAWRFRAADSGAFDRFWQSTIAGLALAVAAPIGVSVEPPMLGPGERGEVTVRVRPNAAVRATLDDDQPIRLIPAAEAGVFRGTFIARSTPGRSRISVETAGTQPRSATRTILVQAGARRVVPPIVAPLSMLSSSHHGVDVAPDHVSDAERFIRRTVTPPAAVVALRPMRSVWWMVPFAACLSGEWWLRRRRGLR